MKINNLIKRIIQVVITIVLIFFALKKVNVNDLILNLLKVPAGLIIFTFFYGLFSTFVSSWRWGVIILKKPKIRDIIFLVRCNYLAMFYGFLLPSSMSNDLIRWVPLLKRYPQHSKLSLAGSVLIDRVVGATAFFPIAMISAILGRILKYSFPDYLFLIFGAGCLAVGMFYFILYFIDFDKLFSRHKFTRKIINIFNLLRKENKSTLIKVFIISFIVQIVGIFAVWVRSLFLNANFSLLSVYIFIPIISLVLMLPISIAGFGAREQMYLYFFSQNVSSDEKILLVSAFAGISNILAALFGGLVALYALYTNYREDKIKVG